MSVMVPHFAFPFALNCTACAVVEQDSSQDIQTCVEVCLMTPPGSRIVLMDYGVPEVLYSQAPVNIPAIIAALNKWEPRGATTISETIDTLDQKIVHMQVNTTRGV